MCMQVPNRQLPFPNWSQSDNFGDLCRSDKLLQVLLYVEVCQRVESKLDDICSCLSNLMDLCNSFVEGAGSHACAQQRFGSSLLKWLRSCFLHGSARYYLSTAAGSRQSSDVAAVCLWIAFARMRHWLSYVRGDRLVFRGMRMHFRQSVVLHTLHGVHRCSCWQPCWLKPTSSAQSVINELRSALTARIACDMRHALTLEEDECAMRGVCHKKSA